MYAKADLDSRLISFPWLVTGYLAAVKQSAMDTSAALIADLVLA